MQFLIFLVSVFYLGSFTASAFAVSPFFAYGETIEFDVLRDGDVVGKHITQFEENNDMLMVSSRMNLDIFLFFLPVYSFNYQANEEWHNDRLISLDVKVVDGGDIMDFRAERHKGALNVMHDEHPYTIEGHILLTSHWNEKVVSDTRVLNTLTGKINHVAITPIGHEEIEVVGGKLDAKRYDYSGDLIDTSVWYDNTGRWVKLRFKGSDGSQIEYRCRNCLTGDKT
jgi:hypothetical protein